MWIQTEPHQHHERGQALQKEILLAPHHEDWQEGENEKLASPCECEINLTAIMNMGKRVRMGRGCSPTGIHQVFAASLGAS